MKQGCRREGGGRAGRQAGRQAGRKAGRHRQRQAGRQGTKGGKCNVLRETPVPIFCCNASSVFLCNACNPDSCFDDAVIDYK